MRLIEQLRWWAAECDRTNFGCQARKLLLEAAEALEKADPQWIPVTERPPENEVDVLICARRGSYKGGFYTHVATAFHTDGKMNTEDSRYNWDIDISDMEYDEEADAYIVPEGWWEAVRYGEEFSAVDDFVTHWMPLPKPPEDGERVALEEVVDIDAQTQRNNAAMRRVIDFVMDGGAENAAT